MAEKTTATKRQGLTKGARILVKLPFGRTEKPKNGKPGKSQLVKVKENVAALLKFQAVKNFQTSKVTFKTASGSATVTRIKSQGSFRERSIKLIFSKARKVGKSPGTYKSVSLPLGSGCTITDAITYFQKNGPSLGIVGLTTPAGKTISGT